MEITSQTNSLMEGKSVSSSTICPETREQVPISHGHKVAASKESSDEVKLWLDPKKTMSPSNHHNFT